MVMGLFDFFSKESKLKRNVAKMGNRNLQAEDREAAARWLVDQGSEEAIAGLLSRFEMNLTQQTKDQKEKEWVHGLLLGMGKPVEGPLRAHLQGCKQFALPLRLLGELAGEAAAKDVALELLEAERSVSQFRPDKKRDLMVWLVEHGDARAADAAAWFLGDFDEGVRYAAIETIARHTDGSHGDQLVAALARPEEDSGRVMHRLAEIIAKRGWSVAGHDLEGRIPAGFTRNGDRLVRG